MEACRRCVFSSRAVAGVAIAPTADRVLPLIGWNRHASNCTGPRTNASRGLTGLQAHRRQVRLSVAPRRRDPASHYAAVSFGSGGSPRDAACRQAGQLSRGLLVVRRAGRGFARPAGVNETSLGGSRRKASSTRPTLTLRFRTASFANPQAASFPSDKSLSARPLISGRVCTSRMHRFRGPY